MIIKFLKTWNRRRLEARKRQKSGIPHLAIQVQELQQILSTSHSGSVVRLAIGVLTQNASATQIHACLHALKQACSGLHPGWQGMIYIGDTTHGREFDDQFAHMSFQVRRLQLLDSTTLSAAENMLLSEAAKTGFTHFISMTADGLPEPDTIKNLVQMSIAVGDGALIEGVLFPDELPKYFNPQTLDTDWVSMTCLLIPSRIYQAIGGFDEDFHRLGVDIDYSWRARSMGFTAKTCPTALYFQSPDAESRLEMASPADRERCASLLTSKWRDLAAKSQPGEKYEAQRNPGIANLELKNHFAMNRW